MNCPGATSGGALTDLVALGAADTYLTMNPSITFWRFRYNKHTNFAMESIEQPFNTQVSFGTDVQVTLNRVGDLLYWMFVVIDLPGIRACVPTLGGICGVGCARFPATNPCNPCGDQPIDDCACPIGPSIVPDDINNLPNDTFFDENGFIDDIDTCTGLQGEWAHWVNDIGQFLVKRACLVVGGQVIDTLYNDYLFMWEELAGQPGKRLLEMVGKRFTRSQLVEDSRQTRRLYVPLPWWFTQISGNALPLVSLQFHGVQIFVCFSDLVSCVQVSHPDVCVVKCSDCQSLTQNDLRAFLDTTYVYLDVEERDRFATGSFEQLITQVQNYTLCTRTCQLRMQLNFNHPIIELIWALRRECQRVVNNNFNYSGFANRDPIAFVQLRLNNQNRFSGREGRYFRLVVPWEVHTDIPDSFIYVYSFALHPEDPQPSGSCNFSRIDNVELIFDLQKELANQDVTVLVFGRNWNVFRYREGLGGLAFANKVELETVYLGPSLVF